MAVYMVFLWPLYGPLHNKDVTYMIHFIKGNKFISIRMAWLLNGADIKIKGNKITAS